MNFEILERRTAERPEAPKSRRWHGLDRPSWRSFFVAMLALAAALFLALYSGAAADAGHLVVAGMSALAALALSGWVALTIVPVLARRTPLRWLTYQIDYKLTREGIVYLGGIFVVTLAAMNTGNNLLFMVLACLLAGVLISGFLSRLVLSWDRSAPGVAGTHLRRASSAGHRRTSQYETDDAVIFGISGQRGADRGLKNPPGPMPRRRFWGSQSTSRTSRTGKPCGKTWN